MKQKLKEYILKTFYGDLDEYEADLIVNFVENEIYITDFMKNKLSDDGVLLGWQSNIACWLMDNLGIVDYHCRNDLAKEFIKKFFDFDYDWVKLLNPSNRTYSADMGLMGGDRSVEMIVGEDLPTVEKLLNPKVKEVIFNDSPSFESCIIKLNNIKDDIRKTLEIGENSELKSVQKREEQINDLKNVIDYMNSLPITGKIEGD